MQRITSSGRLWFGVVAMLACATTVFAQMTPEQAQRLLREKQQQRESLEAEHPVNSTPTPAAAWPQAALRSAGYLCMVNGRAYCNANYDVRYVRTSWRAVGQTGTETRKSFQVKLGEMVTTIDSRGNVKRTPVLYEIVHERPADEQFAQTKAIGPPEPDQFGFIDHARVVQVVDAQTVVFDNVRLLTNSDIQSEYKKQKDIGRVSSYYYYRDDPRYDLHAVISNTVKTPRNSYFDQSLPTPAELYQQRSQMIDWEYQNRLEIAPIQQAWSGRRITLVGLPTATLHAGQTWNGGDTQIAIVAVAGRNVTAVPTTALNKRLDRDALTELMQKSGFTVESMNETIRQITAHRVPGQSIERRIAFILAGRPLSEDVTLLPAELSRQIAAENKTVAAASPDTAANNGPFDVQAALTNMVNDTVGDQSRRIDDLLAAAFEDWWQTHQKGQTVDFSGLFMNASRVEADTYLTNRLTARERASRARFAIGKIRMIRSRSHDADGEGPVTTSTTPLVALEGFSIGQYRFRVTVNALFTGDHEMDPLKLPMPSADQPNSPTLVHGRIVDVQFTSSGSCNIYLDDCSLSQ